MPGSGREAREAPVAARALALTFRVLCAVTVALVVCVAPFVWYACKKSWLVAWGPVLLAAGVLGALAIMALARWASARLAARGVPRAGGFLARRGFSLFVLASFLVLVAAQTAVVSGALFRAGWDSGFLTGGEGESARIYFSQYPNNLFLYGAFKIIARLGAAIGIERGYVAQALVGALSVALSVAMVTVAARRTLGTRAAVVFNVVASLYLGLSPWIIVPYSDTYGMFCPAASLLVLSLAGHDRLRAALLAALAVVGYSIKPTSIFPLAAAILVFLLRLLHREDRARLLRRGLSLALPAALAAVVAFAGCSWLSHRYVDVDESLSLPFTHFLLMGANTETGGVYSAADIEFSNSLPADRRAMGDLVAWADRVAETGPGGVARLALSKQLTNFADGTFAWEVEGGFYIEITGDNPALLEWYGISQDGSDRGFVWALVSQAAWLAVLVGCAWPRREEQTRLELVTQLSLLALMAFLLVFEARARYLFLFAPYFVLLAVHGWDLMARDAAALVRRLGHN